MTRVTPDSPAPVLDERATRERLVGAAAAAIRLAREGWDVELVTGIADDDEGATVAARVEAAGICLRAVALPGPQPRRLRLTAAGRVLGVWERALGPRDRSCLPVGGRADDGSHAVLVVCHGLGLARVAETPTDRTVWVAEHAGCTAPDGVDMLGPAADATPRALQRVRRRLGPPPRTVDAPGHRPRPVPMRDAVRLARAVRAQGGCVVTVGGCFDVLHAGHVRLLTAARSLGDALVVLVNSDASVRRLKGPARPVVPAADRVRMLLALDPVDAVLVFDEDAPEQALRRLKPHLFVKGGDYGGVPLPEADVMRDWGGQAVLLPYHAGRSTSELVSRMAVGSAS